MSDTPTPAQAAEKAIREMPVAAYLVSNLRSGEPSLCFEDERGDYGDEDHTPVFDELVLKSDAEAQLAEMRAEVERLSKNDARYQWLRKQPNNTEAPRIDVVYWQVEDEASNAGDGLRMEALDAAVDAALAADGKDGAR